MNRKKDSLCKDVILGEGMCRIEAVGPSMIHCIYTKRKPETVSSLGINAKPTGILRSGEEDVIVWFETEKLRLEIDQKTEQFLWKDCDGRTLLQENGKELIPIPYIRYSIQGEKPIIRREKTVDGERNFIENLVAVTDHTAYRSRLHFFFQPDEHIYGLGQGEEGIYDYRGTEQYLYQHNMRTPIPFVVSSKNYAILIDCGCIMNFRDDARGSYIEMDCVEQLSYYFIFGERVDDLIAGFRELTGRAVMLPKWSYGYIQSKEAYHTQEELLKVAERYREEQLPIDGIVQDWNTWEKDAWGNKKVDRKRYPDLGGMNRKLHEMNMHSMISIWPTMNSGTDNYQEMSAAGCLLKDDTTYDAFSEKARNLYWKQADEELFQGGFDAWWCDSTEPFSGPDWNGETRREPWERYQLVGNEHKKYLDPDRANLYGTAHAMGIFENQRRERPDKRVLNLTRSGYPSIQKYGTVLWSGDICATWETLKRQVTEGINMGLSGMPYWTLDIGGFFVVHKNWEHRGCFCNTDPEMKWFWRGDYEEGIHDLGYRELYVRWFQYGSFLPMFRSHGTDTPRELWNFGRKGWQFYDALYEALQLRYRLMPYIYSCAAMVNLKHATMIRSLLFDFPEDENVFAISDEYLFGEQILVCPVTKPMYYGRCSEVLNIEKIRECYLPKGVMWHDFYTGEVLQGGQWIRRSTPIDEIPLYIRAGSVIPMEQGLQYAGEQVSTPLEIHIYKGADGAFSLYEDTGDGYRYESGDYQLVQIQWNDQRSELTIGSASEGYPQSIVGRTCIAVMGEQRKEFTYQGKKLCIQMNK